MLQLRVKNLITVVLLSIFLTGCVFQIQPASQRLAALTQNPFDENVMTDTQVYHYFEDKGVGVPQGQVTLKRAAKCILIYAGHGLIFRDQKHGTAEFYRHTPDVARVCRKENASTWTRFFAYGDVFIITNPQQLPNGAELELPPLVESKIVAGKDNLEISAYFVSNGHELDEAEYTIERDICIIVYARNGIVFYDFARADIEFYHYSPDVAKICATDDAALFGAYGDAVFVLGQMDSIND